MMLRVCFKTIQGVVNGMQANKIHKNPQTLTHTHTTHAHSISHESITVGLSNEKADPQQFSANLV